MKPTTVQYILATDWLPACWAWTWSLLAAAAAVWMMEPSLKAFGDPWFALLFLGAAVMSFLFGGYASQIPAWFIFGPVLYAQGIANGGPFVPGDRVRILAGEHRGKVAFVYSTWQHETVRVDLGDAGKATYTDIFAAYQLVREEADNAGVQSELTTVVA